MSDMPTWLTGTADGLSLQIYVQPGARRTAVVGTHGDRLKIAVAAPAREGQANDALLGFLARQLRLRRSALTLASGEAARCKRVIIAGPATSAQVIAALAYP